MTAIPAATEEDFDVMNALERHYVEARSTNPTTPREVSLNLYFRRCLRLLSHYQRENERLARENEKYRSRELQSALRNCSPGQFMEHIKKVAQPKPEVRND